MMIILRAITDKARGKHPLVLTEIPTQKQVFFKSLLFLVMPLDIRKLSPIYQEIAGYNQAHPSDKGN